MTGQSFLPWNKMLSAAAICLLVLITTGCAGRTYSDSSLRADYHYSMVQLRLDETAPNIDYCDEHGTITFDGAGSATGTGTRKCSITGLATETGTFTYSVDPDGSFLITESGASESTHGQIVHGDKILLIDGSTRPPDILIMHGIAVKK